MLDFLLLGLWTVSWNGGVFALQDGPVSTKCRSASPTPSPPPRAEMVPPLSVEEVEPNLKCDPAPFGTLEVATSLSAVATRAEVDAGGPVRMKSSAPETTKVENLESRRVDMSETKRQKHRLLEPGLTC